MSCGLAFPLSVRDFEMWTHFWRKVSQNVNKEKFTILFGDLKKLYRKPEPCHGSVSQGQLAEINVLDSNPFCPHRRTTFL